MATCTAAARAHADGDVAIGGSPRAIGRAGAATVGDDGGGALLVNPAAMARRGDARAQAGVAVVDDALRFRALRGGAPPEPTQGPPALAPLAAAEAALGDWVIGAGVMTAAVTARALRSPSELPPSEVGAGFDARYAGIAGSRRRDTVAIGAARRLGEQVAIGASVTTSRVAIDETRRLWAGFDGRDALGDPAHDVEVALSARDAFVPGAVIGAFAAPEDSPLELGASVGYGAATHATGHVVASGVAGGPAVGADPATATIALPAAWSVRGGARYVGDRLVVEADVDWFHVPARATAATWSIGEVALRDPSGFTSVLAPIPSRISARSRVAIRTAADLAVVEGFLWVTAGYAFAQPGVAATRQSPTFGDLGGHTFALGLELVAGGATITLGYARTVAPTVDVPRPAWNLDNPFPGGDRRAFGGRYDGSTDQVGLLVELAR